MPARGARGPARPSRGRSLTPADSINVDIDGHLDYYSLAGFPRHSAGSFFFFNLTVNAELIPFLKTVPLFADLSDPALAVIASVARLKRISKNVTIFDKDDPGDAAYVVRKGTIAITLNSVDGRELVIYEMHPGDCFGELALLTNQPRSAGAIAREASEVLAIPRAEFMAELSAQPQVMRHLNEIIAQRLRQSTERESALAFLDADTRLARILLHLDRQSSSEGYVTISQDELSKRTGVARQTAAKTLGKWRRAGWIITGRGRIVVLDHGALRRLAEKL